MLHLKMNLELTQQAVKAADAHLSDALAACHQDLLVRNHGDQDLAMGLTYAALFYALADLLASESDRCLGHRDVRGTVRVCNDLMHVVNQYRTAINSVRTGGSN
jgi:hypothetical protein